MGKDWIGSSNASFQYNDSTIVAFEFHTFDTDTMFLEEMVFIRIPLKVGKYRLTDSHTSAKGIYWVGYFDEIDALYDIAMPLVPLNNNGQYLGTSLLAEKARSYLWIDAYDPATKLITGRFQASYVKHLNNLFNYPSTVSFRDGSFSVKLY